MGKYSCTAWGSENNAIVLRMADIYLLYAEASNEVSGNPNSSTFGMSAYDAITQSVIEHR